MFEAFTSFFEHFEMKSPVITSKYERLKNALSAYDGNILFCETDTYPVMPLEILFDDLANGKVYLYEEGEKNAANHLNLVIGLNKSNNKYLQEIVEARTIHAIQNNSKPEIKNTLSFFGHYKNLPEFKILLQSFFRKNEEESIPNLIKAAHHFDAQQILKEKEEYHNLPLYKKWFRNIKGTNWSIKQYEKKF